MNRYIRIAFVFLAVATVLSCDGGGTKTGNGITTQVRAYSSVGPPVVKSLTRSVANPASAGMALWAPDAQGTVFSFASIRAYVRDIEFELPEDETCEDHPPETFLPPVSCNARRARVDGPWVAELANGTFYPYLGPFGIPPGAYTYSAARLDLATLEEGVILPGDPLEGVSLWGSGTFTYQSVARTFEFSLPATEILTYENVFGIPVTDAVIDPVVLQMDVALWFLPLNLTQCLDSGELVFATGTHLVIADSGTVGGACETIGSDLIAAVKSSGELSED